MTRPQEPASATTRRVNARGFADGLGEISESDAAALVPQIKAGDSEALGQLYRHGRERVERYLKRRMVDTTDVEDVVQETFLRVPEMTKDFNPDTTEVGAWLCGRVARWTLTDYGRKDRFERLSARDTASRALSESIHTGPVQDARDREATPLSPRMVHALAKLAPAQRRGMQLRYLDEMTAEQAAEVAGSSAGAVVQNCVAARKKLRAELADVAPVSTSALAGMSKKDAVLTALRTVGTDNPTGAMAWLKEHGVKVDDSYVYAIRNGRRPETAVVEPAPRSAAEIADAEHTLERVTSSSSATKKELACAAARLYDARNGRLPSPDELTQLVDGVSRTTAVVGLRAARQQRADTDDAATAQDKVPHQDQDQDVEDVAEASVRPEPAAEIPQPRVAEPEQPTQDRAASALEASRQRTDDALQAAAAAVRQLRPEPVRVEGAEQERARELSRWQAEDETDEDARENRRALELAS
ncbi:sigma-70 family RNA polymerase sigma factor [Amycolatopsis sp. H20-H5]|uniref:sigma-70 family RNA polymerase sigma factor n=1 Tax=Amycolatopsis sp. H20-H5 TaxID=3046309 RepID=UPI002DB95E86|nr:sigma-70 family RNA polymerase sigma factor [Amycolatopsis sp. H20-H5]MEC3974572.1 sigma-70 family RNA polymerase sigma factor [Amycolatopsis sp. H20-H5]